MRLLVLLLFLALAWAAAPVAIDSGMTWLRLAHYNPNSVEGIDVVASEQGDRRFASIVGFSQDRTVQQVPRLLSYAYGEVIYRRYSFDFQRLPLVELHDGLIGVNAGWEYIPSIPEINALMLRYGLSQARAQLNLSVGANEPVPVVNVAASGSTIAFHRAMVQVLEAAGAFVKTTISSGAAAGVDWAERRLKPTEEAYVVIADVGTLGSTAALLHAKRTRSGHLTLKVIKHAEDESLGGFRIDQAIAQWLKKKVETARPVSEWTAKREARVMAAARELKEALSASPQTEVFIEEMLPDWDFKAAVTREEIDEVCKEIYEAFAQYNPVRQLRESGAFNDITVQNLEVIGGSSRLPKILAILGAEGLPLARHLSADESVVWGAAEYGRLLENNGIELHEVMPPPFFPDQLRPLPKEDIDALHEAMKKHEEREELKRKKAATRNRLETLLMTAREGELSEEANAAVRGVSAWLDDVVEATTSIEDYEAKISEVQGVLQKTPGTKALKEEL